MMKRSVRWTLVLAILGFILGLGFMVPLPNDEARSPASRTSLGMVFISPADAVPDTLPPPDDSEAGDPRRDVLFDVHTVSRSKYANGIDAFVLTRFTDDSRTEIDRFTYCHNYDYENLRARPNTNRYDPQPNGFTCSRITLRELAAEYPLIETPLGGLLSLKSAPGFHPRRGGKILVEFAYRVAKVGKNDYRSLPLTLVLRNGVVQIGGPKLELFHWMNLQMSEDFLNFPNGINSFELRLGDRAVSKYTERTFPKFDNLSE